jgi:diguanylate cyclase (GGDEF)-like protein
VGPLSAVGEACAEARQVLWQDVAMARRDQPLFDDGEPSWKTGALLAVPLVRDRAVLGALVVESARPGAIREHALRMISLLAELLTPHLESLWNYEDVERRARTDALTGLWNRRHFDGELARWVSYVDRYGGELSVVLADVDHFKRVNDTHGHEAGDRVLQHVATLLRDGARTQDVVARLGGEEFVLLLPNTGAAGAAEVAERLRVTLAERPAAIGGGASLGVTASFGVSAYPAPVVQRDRVLAGADAALYAAKRDGRNCVRLAGA